MTCADCSRRGEPGAVHPAGWLLPDPATGEPRRFVTRWEAHVAGHGASLAGSRPSHALAYALVEVVASPPLAAAL